jgi:cytochrome c553
MKQLKLLSVSVSGVVAILLAAPVMAADQLAGQKIAEAACAACHGAQGNKPALPDAARLAGQHEDYLLKALKDYKSGARKNGIMVDQVSKLSAQDLQNLAAYYAHQSDGLKLK